MRHRRPTGVHEPQPLRIWPCRTQIDFAFALFDADYDGLVSKDELIAYLASVFSVLFVLAPGRPGPSQSPKWKRARGQFVSCTAWEVIPLPAGWASADLASALDGASSAAQLAATTASTAFEEAGLLETSKLGKGHFKAFVQNGLRDL